MISDDAMRPLGVLVPVIVMGIKVGVAWSSVDSNSSVGLDDIDDIDVSLDTVTSSESTSEDVSDDVSESTNEEKGRGGDGGTGGGTWKRGFFIHPGGDHGVARSSSG
jgi:hypothetical protein